MSIVDRFGLNYKNSDIIRHKLLESANKSNKYVQNIYHNYQLFYKKKKKKNSIMSLNIPYLKHFSKLPTMGAIFSPSHT